MKVKKIILAVTSFAVMHTQAGLDTLIGNVMPEGTMSNSTAPAIVEDQKAGYATGGSTVIATKPYGDFQLIQATPPSCDLGGLPCGAQFEFFGGGLSLAKGKELMNHLKGMGTGAVAYAGIMAIKTTCDTCYNAMQHIKDAADKINELGNLNCQDMQDMMDGWLQQEKAKSEGQKQSNNILKGGKQDMAENQKKSKKNEPVPKGDDLDPKMKSQLPEEFNLVWYALKQRTGVQGLGSELDEFLMSISGTIVGKRDKDGGILIKHYPSLVSKELVKELVSGSNHENENKTDIKLYKCDEHSQCLKPKKEPKKIDKRTFISSRIHEILRKIIQKTYDNQGSFDRREQTIISLSSLPILKSAENGLQMHPSVESVLHNHTDFVEALSYDVIIGYLKLLLGEVDEAIGDLSGHQMADKEKFEAMRKDISEIYQELNHMHHKSFERLNTMLNTKQRAAAMDKATENDFEAYINEM